MGIVLSRFRKKKTTIEVLEELDTKIKNIEQYGENTEQRHKKIVGTLVIYSVALYIMTAFIFYFCFFPASLFDQIFYITPLLIFPILILFTKKMVTWYYKRKISRNQEKLSTMQDEKKKILDEVTETETYKKAKEILLKFAPDQLRMTPLTPQPMIKMSPATASPRQSSTPQTVTSPASGAGELRRRVFPGANQPINTQIGKPMNPGVAPSGWLQSPLPGTPIPAGAKMINTSIGTRRPLPRPILPCQRSYLDRLVDYLVGDGPSNRYALICRQCESHNGMALKEEFEYFGFRCCYCNFWNPPRKQKPSAPKLENEITPPYNPALLMDGPGREGLSKNLEARTLETEFETAQTSDTDSDIEVVERPPETPENTEEIDNGGTHDEEKSTKDVDLKSTLQNEKEEKSCDEC